MNDTPVGKDELTGIGMLHSKFANLFESDNGDLANWHVFSIKFMLKCHSCLQEPMLLGDRLGQTTKEILSIQGREDLTENAV